MSDEKVIFDNKGGYSFGSSLQEMSVQTGKVGKARTFTPSSDTSAETSKAKPQKMNGPRPFDLNALRRQAGLAKKAKEEEPAVTIPSKVETEEKFKATEEIKEEFVETKSLTDSSTVAKEEVSVAEAEVEEAPVVPTETASEAVPVEVPIIPVEETLIEVDTTVSTEITLEEESAVEVETTTENEVQENIVEQTPVSDSIVEVSENVSDESNNVVEEDVLAMSANKQKEEEQVSTIEQEEKVVAPTPEQPKRPAFSLQQLGLSRAAVDKKVEVKSDDEPKEVVEEPVVEPAPEEIASAEESTPVEEQVAEVAEESNPSAEEENSSIKKMTLGEETLNNAEPTEKVLSESESVPEQTEFVPPISNEEAEAILHPADDEPFEIGTLDKLMRVCHANPEIVTRFIRNAMKASAKNSSAIFSSSYYPDMRAYSIFFSARGNINIALGVGKMIVAVFYNKNKDRLEDVSHQISISGTCAVVQGSPVASVSQRKRDTIVL